MADIEQILKTIKDSAIGAVAVTTADILTGGGVSATAAGIGVAIGAAASLLNKEEDKEPTTHSSSTSARKEPEQHYEPSLDFNASNTSSFGSPQGFIAGGASQTNNTPDWNNIPEPKIWKLPEGDGRELWDSDYSEHDNYSERTPNITEGTFWEHIKTETEIPRTCLTETENCESCGIQVPKSTEDTIKPEKQIPQDIQAAIDRWKGRSPTRTCNKHGVEMPANSCYSCNGGQKCEHLAIYDGTHKKAHCVYVNKDRRLTDYHNHNAPPVIDDFVASECNTCSSDVCSDSINGTPFKAGKPLKQHRKSNRTKMTGIELAQLRALVDKTNVEDKESLWAEVQDHIDPSLNFAENKAIIEDYLSAVTPMNTNITDAEVKEIEEKMARDTQKKIAQKRWEDDTLIEILKMRAEQGDSSAGSELELIEIERASFTPPVPPIEPVSVPAFPTENISPPAFETAPPIEPIITPFVPLENPIVTPPIVETPPIQSPIIETPPTIDPAMSWCSSTPETIEFSKNFVQPTEQSLESYYKPAQATASPQVQNSINQQYII